MIKNVRSIIEQVDDISKRAVKAGYSEDVKTAAEELTKKFKALEESLIQTKNESGQDAINYQVKLDNHLAYLYSFVHEQDSKPNQSITDRFALLKAHLDTAEKDYQALVETDLKSFTTLLEENEIPRIIVEKKSDTN
jgi:phenylalanyl-tRNA synthetase alpha subunit